MVAYLHFFENAEKKFSFGKAEFKKILQILPILLFFLLFLGLFSPPKILAQTDNVGIGTAYPFLYSILDLRSTTKGFLVPRLTSAQKTAITVNLTSADSTKGLLIYQTDGTPGFYYWNGTAWTTIGGGGSGTVTSVGLALPSDFTVTNSPVTGSGTLTGTWNTKANHLFFGGPITGGPSTPAFRALDSSDVPGVDATKLISGILPILRGGTGISTTPIAGSVAYGNGTTLGYTAAGTTGQVLTSNGAGTPTWTTASGTGTVTSVGLALPTNEFTITNSPVTGSGTLTGSWKTQANHSIFAGPITGGPLAPTFRALDSSDVPGVDASKVVTGILGVSRGGTGITTTPPAGTIAYGNGTTLGYTAAGTTGQVLTSNGTGIPTWAAAGGSGTVTSVGLALPSDFTVTNSPVTGSGTLTGVWATKANHLFLSGPITGGPLAPTFRAIDSSDVPGVDATKLISGTLGISRGGTGITTSPPAGTIAYGNGTTLGYTAAGTTGQVLTSNGTGTPTWATRSSIRSSKNGSTQSINSGSATKVTFDTEQFDVKSEFSGSTFTALEDGYYQVNSRIEFTVTSPNASTYVSVYIYVSGTLWAEGNNLAVRSSGTQTILTNNAPVVSDVVKLTAGQTIEIWAYQNTGAAQPIATGAAITYVSIHKLS